MFFAVFLLTIYFIFLIFILKKSYTKNSIYPILYIILFLPTYSFFQIIIYDISNQVFLVELIKYSKDFTIFSILFIYLFGRKNPLLNIKWKITNLDILFLLFTLTVFCFIVFQIGESNFTERIIYGKNLLLISSVYFIGRNINYSLLDLNYINKILVLLTIIACFVSIFEFLTNTHLHSLINYSSYYLDLYSIDPTGNYGLSWTFERPGPIKRYGSFFADPLEFSSFLLLGFSIGIYKIFKSNILVNKLYHCLFISIVIFGFYLSYSRSAILGGFLLLFFSLFLMNKFRLFINLFLLTFLLAFLIYYNSSLETKYFIIDSITFQNSSSLGHLFNWIQGILSIYDNPFGTGLGTSGNSISVDNEIAIGGENQFIIIGVQMGIVALINYVGLIIYSIYNSYKLYNLEKDKSLKYLPFIVCCLKFSLILPLLTSNAEIYTFISLFGWFFVGLNERRYSILKN